MSEIKNKIVTLEDMKVVYDNLESKVGSSYSFKGSCLFSELPTDATVATNDTWYVTDKKCNYTWNGTAWCQSSLNETDYESELELKADKTTTDALRETTIALAIKPTASGTVINITDSADYELQDLQIVGNSTQNGTPTPGAPIDIVSIGDGGSVDITVCGKNLFNINNIADVYVTDTAIRSGVTFTNLGVLTLKSCATTTGIFYKTIKKGVYGYAFELKNVPQTVDTTGCTLIVYSISDTDLINNQVQVECGNTVGDYEPYKEQTLTIPLSEPLRGIGNYKDTLTVRADGTGEVVRKIAMLDSSKLRVVQWSNPSFWFIMEKSSTIPTPMNTAIAYINITNKKEYYWDAGYTHYFLQNAGQKVVIIPIGSKYPTQESVQALLNSGVVVQYVMKTPITTQLTKEEVQSILAATKSYYGTTNIINSESAGMSATYIADTKNYIDNKLADLTALALEG